MRRPQVQFTLRSSLVALLLATVVSGSWFLYWVASRSLEAERTLHTLRFTIRLVERFVSERGRWPRSWAELEELKTREDLFGQEWPAASQKIQRRVVIDFGTEPRDIAGQNPMGFTAIRPIGPYYEYRDSGAVESLQRAIRRSITRDATQ